MQIDIGQILSAYDRVSRRGSSLVAALVAVLFGYLAVQNTQQLSGVLTTLATAQASILAIVFSVTLLGIQLVANRYSPRMTSVIVSADIFRFTFLLFAVSIAAELLLVMATPSLNPPLILIGVAFVLATSIGTVAALWRFFDYILEVSTPEGLLTEYVEQLTPEQYRGAVAASRGDPESNHPLHELHDVIMSALSQGEWSTANNGLHQFEVIAKEVIRDASKTNRMHRLNDDLSRYYFRIPFEEYFPRIAAKAADMGEDDIVRQTVETVENVAIVACENHRPSISSQAATSFGAIIRGAEDGEEGDTVRWSCLSAYKEILVTLANQPAPNDISTFLSLYASEFRKFLGRDRESWVYRQSLNEFFDEGVKPSIRVTLDQYGTFVASQDVDWRKEYEPSNVTGCFPLELLFDYRRYLIDVTMDILSYVDRNGEWPESELLVRDSWRDICEITLNSEATDYGRMFCQLYIDLGFMVYQVDEDVALTWSNEVARLRNRVSNPDVIDQAFEISLEEGMTPIFSSKLSHFPIHQKPETSSEKFIEAVFSKNMDYEAWVQELHESSDEHYEEYFGSN